MQQQRQERRQHGQRQAGDQPVRHALRHHLHLERQRHQRQRLERAILVIGEKQALERQSAASSAVTHDDARRRSAATIRAPARRRTETESRSSTKNADHHGRVAALAQARRRSRAHQKRSRNASRRSISASAPHRRSGRSPRARDRTASASATVGVGRDRDPPPGAAMRARSPHGDRRPPRRRGRSGGSSSSQSGAWLATSRASARRRRWPADRKRHGVAAAPVRPKCAERFGRRRRAPAHSRPEGQGLARGQGRLQRVGMADEMQRARCAAGSSAIGAAVPGKRPGFGAPRPAMRRSRLDLPLPLGPVRISASPSFRAKSSPANTSRSPRRQARPRPVNPAGAESGDRGWGMKDGHEDAAGSCHGLA